MLSKEVDRRLELRRLRQEDSLVYIVSARSASIMREILSQINKQANNFFFKLKKGNVLAQP